MNVYIRIEDIKDRFDKSIQLHDYIRYLYPKRNTIMEGEFTKILFSNRYVTINGLYLHLPIKFDRRSEDMHHYRGIKDRVNYQLIMELKELEVKLLQHFKQSMQKTVEFDTILSKQLNTGNIRVYQEKERTRTNECVLKISGIWESQGKIGLTYKILEL